MGKDTTIIDINGRQVKMLNEEESAFACCSGKQQVFIIGSKGIPAAYGGFETFVDKLTEYRNNNKIQYHVSRMGTDNVQYEYNGARCFNIAVPAIGPAKAVYYDIAALKACIDYCRKRPDIRRPVFYILACRIGPFIGYFKRKIKKLGGVLYVNPDGHEWKRAKWSAPVRKYWRFSERLMVKYADLLICDSRNIEKYIQKEYRKYHPETTYIAYGSDTKKSVLADNDVKYTDWLKSNNLKPKGYYLIVGRFVPENNFETMIREFMKSDSKRDLAIITTANEAFLNDLEQKLHFMNDPRIRFVGTVYDQELLKKIRENAYGYLHGHEVGGTNPSLLEALGSTNLNLLLKVGFNKEVAEDAALYWTKKAGSLASLIDNADAVSEQKIQTLGRKAKKRIVEAYSWESIVALYEDLFLRNNR